MNKNRFWDIATICCVFLFCVSFPFNIFTNNLYIIFCCQCLLKILALVFAYFYSHRSSYIYLENNPINWKELLILIPTFLAVLNNGVYLLFDLKNISFSFSNIFILQAFSTLITACLEEFIFRHIIINNISKPKKIHKILISAAIFSAFHLVNFFSTFNPYDLISVIYTFGIGIILGFLYIYTKSIVPCIAFHFLYNLLNSDLYNLFNVGEDWLFYVISCITAIVVGIYLLIYYLLKEKKNKYI